MLLLGRGGLTWSRLSGGSRRLRAGATCNIRAAKDVQPTMNWPKHFIEAATLIVAAVVCALVSNAVASRERKVVVVNGGQPPPAVRPALKPTATVASGGPLSSTAAPAHAP